MSARIPHRDGLKQCTTCKAWRALDQYQASANRWDGLQRTCKACFQAMYRKRRGPAPLLMTAEEKIASRSRANRKWRVANRSALSESVRLSGRNNERAARRKAQTPAWADPKKIVAFYQLVPLVNEETGVIHHVDHIVPLKSNFVCGLHCEANLQVIPAVENVRKGNKTWPDM